jgi:hypothetical protein
MALSDVRATWLPVTASGAPYTEVLLSETLVKLAETGMYVTITAPPPRPFFSFIYNLCDSLGTHRV